MADFGTQGDITQLGDKVENYNGAPEGTKENRENAIWKNFQS